MPVYDENMRACTSKQHGSRAAVADAVSGSTATSDYCDFAGEAEVVLKF